MSRTQHMETVKQCLLDCKALKLHWGQCITHSSFLLPSSLRERHRSRASAILKVHAELRIFTKTCLPCLP